MNNQIRLIASMLIITVCLGHLKAQTYESRNYVKIPANREIIKTMKAKNCLEVLEAGTVVQYETKQKKGTVEYTISKRDSLESCKTYPFDKEITIKMQSLRGKANLTIDEKDPSLLQVNYWISSKKVLKKGTKIHLIYRELRCDTLMKPKKEIKTILKSDTSIYLASAYRDTFPKTLWQKLKIKKHENVYYADTIHDWYKYSDIILKIYDGEKQTGLYANMYDRNAQYTLKLQNREYISYPKSGWEFGALTIPLKYRRSYTKSVEGVDIKVKDEFIADFNIGTYGGYQIGRNRLRMEGSKLRELTQVGCSFGGFVSFSTTDLDSLNTTAGDIPFTKDKKSTIGIISPGIAAMFTLYNFQIGTFAGWDLAIGQNRKNWNHKDRLWIGFGFGYKLGGFWKK